MKQTIDTRLTQHLALTPQLQQAIRLLLLSTQELRQEIEQTMELNPLLEYEDDIVMEAAAENTDENTATEPESELDPASLEITEDSSNDTHWDDIYPAGSGSSADAQTYEVQGTTTDSLRDHLLWQLRLSHCTETDNAIATAIIDAINDDGFLTISLADIHASLGEENEINIDTDEIEAMLHRIQHYDPPRCGCKRSQRMFIDPITTISKRHTLFARSKINC
jgi:RNA polymerase sigma-54 factor